MTELSTDDLGLSPANGSSLSRRRMLQAIFLAGPAAMAASACARATPSQPPAASGGSGSASSGVPSLQLASPENPVAWPINPGNEPIASGLTPERNATLRLYNYADYLNPGVVAAFEEKYAEYGVKVELSTFNDTLEALAKIRGGSVPFDVYFPSYDSIGKLVLSNLVRPLNHSYIPNIVNVYPEFTNPFYDLGWQYTTPYTLYTTGIGWRTDRVSQDISALANPYDVLWDPQYREHLAVLDEYREVISMTILRNGGSDVNTGDDAVLSQVSQALATMNEVTQPRVASTGYTDIPEGRTDLSQVWSGDLILAQSYLPKGTDPSILRYWFPKDGKGVVNNDIMVLLKGGQNPVLGHLFINHVLDTAQSMNNFAYTGYQPPQVSITPDRLVSDGVIPENLKATVVLPGYFNAGYRNLELPPPTEAKYLAIWQQFKAGA